MTAQLQVSYQDPDGRGHYHQFFANFINRDDIDFGWGKNWGENLWENVNQKLGQEYNAKLIKTRKGVVIVEFPTEQDITLFLLRWS